MSGWLFRFLHAGGFRLDGPWEGLGDPPEALLDLLIDAPYGAVQRVFDAAVAEQVDCLVLTGDLIDLAHATPRSLALLLEQFERLKQAGIPVYWAGGRLDPPGEWPSALALPDQVTYFASAQAQEVGHLRAGRPVARVVGQSWHGTSQVPLRVTDEGGDGLPTLAISYGQADPQRLLSQRADYWALGGRGQRHTAGTDRRVVHDPGSPQGRLPAEEGPQGCTLVQLASDRTWHLRLVPTDGVRWQTLRLTIPPDASLTSVRHWLAEQAHQVRSEAAPRPVLATWKLSGGAHLVSPVLRADLAAEWLQWLRQDLAQQPGQPLLWTCAVELEPLPLPETWLEEDSMLGDFLRASHTEQQRSQWDWDWASRAGGALAGSEEAPWGSLGPDEYREVLAAATVSGAQLLGAGQRERQR
jgi:hypothetical protein